MQNKTDVIIVNIWLIQSYYIFIVEELGRERERNEGGVSKREKMVKTWIKSVVTVIVVI